jgi:hypothetical protein
MGKNMKESILVVTDRATLFTRLTKLPNKRAQQVLEAIKLEYCGKLTAVCKQKNPNSKDYQGFLRFIAGY